MFRPRVNQLCVQSCLRMSILSQDPGHIVLRDLFYEDYKNQVEVEAKKNYLRFKENLDVTFVASDGNIKCHSKLLSILSSFFKNKIEGSKNLGCSLEFDYTAYEMKVIKWFLDYCYCVAEPLENESLDLTLTILKFLHDEGKTDVSGLHSKLFSFSKITLFVIERI